MDFKSILAKLKTDRKMQMVALFVVIVVFAMLFNALAPANMVDVKIYKHRETGDLIYCKTGTLTNEFHDYQGEGQIDASKAESC